MIQLANRKESPDPLHLAELILRFPSLAAMAVQDGLSLYWGWLLGEDDSPEARQLTAKVYRNLGPLITSDLPYGAAHAHPARGT